MSEPTALGVCPCCQQGPLEAFYRQEGVPTNSCVLLSTPEEARAWPRGDIALAFCGSCGFITNAAFDPSLTEYSERYEETQGFSGTFNAFHQQLAAELIDRHAIRGKRVMEIGCGKGEFLQLLCALGNNRGVGYDPSFVPERMPDAGARFDVVREFFPDGYRGETADFVCCKMTLEHIPQPYGFLSAVRRPAEGATVFFMVPDAAHVLGDVAFWDIYYEHCSYFTPGALARLFRRCGFAPLDLRSAYGGQYLMIEAHLANGSPAPALSKEESVSKTRELVEAFKARFPERRDRWRELLSAWRAAGRRVVLWGSGSKAVAFLTTLGVESEVSYVVDINPFRHGMYMPGTRQLIVGPNELSEIRPDVVVIMNPVYRAEIEAQLSRLGLSPNILTV